MRNFRVEKRPLFPAVIYKPNISMPIEPYVARVIWAKQLRDCATETEIYALKNRIEELEHKIWEMTHQPQLQAMIQNQANANAMAYNGQSLGMPYGYPTLDPLIFRRFSCMYRIMIFCKENWTLLLCVDIFVADSLQASSLSFYTQPL